MSMKFLIVSDTHGRMYNLEEAVELLTFHGLLKVIQPSMGLAHYPKFLTLALPWADG